MNTLDSTLKMCAFNINKLDTMFPKGKTQGKHISFTHTKHDHNAYHNHTFIYGKVYNCTHCGRKGHLAKFCYSKLNLKAKNIWVREKTNPIRLKKMWVPKNTPNSLDVGVSSSKM